MKGDYIGELEIFKQTGYISRIQSRGKVRILELDRTFSTMDSGQIRILMNI